MKELWTETYRPKVAADYVFTDASQRQQVDSWIKEGATIHGKSVIESRLEEQLASMKAKSVAPPWKPPVFTLE
jgi:hypothetical protein